MQIKNYYKLTKPGIIRGNILHVIIGAFIAKPVFDQDIGALLGVIIGTTLVIASACVVNNYTDRSLDQKMSRTKSRPSANGSVPIQNAIIFAVVLAIAGFGVLMALTNVLVVALGVVAYLSYTWWYAIAKRRSVHGTVVGALPGALPVLAGYSAVNGTLTFVAYLFFALIFVWQIPHFYAISVYRREEYKKASLPVAGVVWHISKIKHAVTAGIVIYIILLVVSALEGGMTPIAMSIVLLVALWWLKVSLQSTDDPNKWARAVFGWSLLVTVTLFIAVLLDYFIGQQLYATLIP